MTMRPLLLAMLAACTGCATIKTASSFHGVSIEHGDSPIETVEIENSGWLLFKFIPLGSGNPDLPNRASCRLFRNTVTLQNNIDMLMKEMDRVGATKAATIASRKTDETIFIIFLTRHAYHTSAVLLE